MQHSEKNIYLNGTRNTAFPVQDRPQCPAYLSPNCSLSQIGIVVIQEWWGLNCSITLTADLFAAQGLLAIVPDIYRCKTADSREDAQHKMEGLDFAGAIKDIDGARQFLLSKGCKTVHIVGFCMGGALTLATIINFTGFTKAFPFYGIPPGIDKMDLSKVTAEVFAFYGEEDTMKGFSDPQAAQVLKAAFEKAGKPFQLNMMKAGHAFMNQDSPNYRKEAADAAFSQVMKEIKG